MPVITRIHLRDHCPDINSPHCRQVDLCIFRIVSAFNQAVYLAKTNGPVTIMLGGRAKQVHQHLSPEITTITPNMEPQNIGWAMLGLILVAKGYHKEFIVAVREKRSACNDLKTIASGIGDIQSQDPVWCYTHSITVNHYADEAIRVTANSLAQLVSRK